MPLDLGAAHVTGAAVQLNGFVDDELARGDKVRGQEHWREARASFQRLGMKLEVERMSTEA